MRAETGDQLAANSCRPTTTVRQVRWSAAGPMEHSPRLSGRWGPNPAVRAAAGQAGRLVCRSRRQVSVCDDVSAVPNAWF